MPERIGLRSHGCVESKWVPTKGRFTSLEAKDESWARYFGLGKIITVPMELYDVRDLNGELIGYSKQDPAKYQNRILNIGVMDERVDRQCYRDVTSPIRRGSIKTIEVMPRSFVVEHEWFVCWYVRIEDAADLARSDWLKCIGEDRLERFIWDLQKRKYEMLDRNKSFYRSAFL